MSQVNFPEQAVATLLSKAHDPVYFDKLASDYGIIARTPQERTQLLELGVILRDQYENDQVKQASSGNSFLSGALDSLKVTLGEQGRASLPTGDEVRIKEAAAQAVAQDVDLREAALQYATFLSSVN